MYVGYNNSSKQYDIELIDVFLILVLSTQVSDPSVSCLDHDNEISLGFVPFFFCVLDGVIVLLLTV